MDIDFGEEKEEEGRKYPAYVVAVLIAMSGLAFLFFVIYYFAFLPVPSAMQPLRFRILTTVQLEQVINEKGTEIYQVVEETNLYAETNTEAEIISTAYKGNFYEQLNEEEGWIFVERIDAEETEPGWIQEEFVESIGD